MTNETLEQIRTEIATALLKRGFTAPIRAEIAERNFKQRVEIESDAFQTTPVLFKQINIASFGSSIVRNEETNINRVTIRIDAQYLGIGLAIVFLVVTIIGLLSVVDTLTDIIAEKVKSLIKEQK